MVCRYLHITLPELRKMDSAEILWHYNHAINFEVERRTEQTELLEFLMQIVNPSMYKEYLNIKNSPVHEVANSVAETDEEFQELVAKANAQLKSLNIENLAEKRTLDVIQGVTSIEDKMQKKPSLDVSLQKQPQQVVAPSSVTNPNVQPPKWGRPADLGEIKVTGKTEEEDDGSNPVFFIE